MLRLQTFLLAMLYLVYYLMLRLEILPLSVLCLVYYLIAETRDNATVHTERCWHCLCVVLYITWLKKVWNEIYISPADRQFMYRYCHCPCCVLYFNWLLRLLILSLSMLLLIYIVWSLRLEILSLPMLRLGYFDYYSAAVHAVSCILLIMRFIHNIATGLATSCILLDNCDYKYCHCPGCIL